MRKDTPSVHSTYQTRTVETLDRNADPSQTQSHPSIQGFKPSTLNNRLYTHPHLNHWDPHPLANGMYDFLPKNPHALQQIFPTFSGMQ